MLGKILCLFVLMFVWESGKYAAAQNNGGCELYDQDGNLISNLDWQFDYRIRPNMADDAAPGSDVYIFNTANILTATTGEPTQPPSRVSYVTFELDADKKLIMRPTSNFANYERDETSDSFLAVPVDFTCGSGPGLMRFNIYIDWTNNNAPVFAADTEDVLELSMPYPNGLYVSTITVTDIDVGAKEVVLTLDAVGDDMFIVVPKAPQGKIFTYDLKTKRQLKLDEMVQVIATVTTTQNSVASTAQATLSFDPDVVLSTPPDPRFSEAVYTGSIDVDTAVGSEIIISPAVTFSDGYHDTDLTVALVAGIHVDPTWFDVSLVGNSVKVTLNTALPVETLDLTHLVLTLEATRLNAYATGRTVIVLELPPKECATTPAPETTVQVTDCPVLTTTECEVVTCPPVTTPDMTTTDCPACPTTDTPTECPDICPTTTEPTECPTTDAPTECPSCPTTEAPTECPPTEAPTECPPTEAPTECPTSELPTECPICPTTDAPTDCPPTDAPTECPTSESSTECPICPTTEAPTECPITCPSTEAPTECPTTCEPCATSPGTTTTECPITCPTTEAPTECPTTCEPCSTSPGPGTGTIVFSPPSYATSLPALHSGFVLKVNAVTDPVQEVVYRIDTDNEAVDQHVSIDAADGSVFSNNLVPGVYKFAVVANVVGTTLTASAPVIIEVRSVTQCGDQMMFLYSLVVVNVMEGVEEVVVPGDDTVVEGTDCVYEVLEGEEYFYTNASTGELASRLNALDREDPIFNGAEQPTVRARLRVTCAAPRGAETSNSLSRRGANYEWSVVASQTDMVVLAFIDDANDNAPVFDVTTLVVGYPDSSLSSQLSRESLVTVKATDADIGFNAELEYSIVADATSHLFHIHPTSGTLYVVNADYMGGDRVVKVVATDQAGAGKPSPQLTIEVKLLSRSHVTDMVIKGVLLEDVAAILSSLTTATNLAVNALEAAVLPRQADQKASETVLLRLMVYAVDGSDLVLATDFVKQLQELPSLEFDVQDVKELEVVGVPATDTSGLEAAVIALGVICGLLVVAGCVAFYFFYVRPRMQEKARMENLIASGYDDTGSSVSGEELTETHDDETKVNVDNWTRHGGDDNAGLNNDEPDSFNMVRSPSSPELEGVTVDGGVLTEFLMPDANGDAPGDVALPRTTGVDAADDEEEEYDENEERRKARLAERKRSMVTFNESVDCIEVESERV